MSDYHNSIQDHNDRVIAQSDSRLDPPEQSDWDMIYEFMENVDLDGDYTFASGLEAIADKLTKFVRENDFTYIEYKDPVEAWFRDNFWIFVTDKDNGEVE